MEGDGAQARFPELYKARARLREAEGALAGLLPQLRKKLGMPRLEYCSIQNQGSYMIEVPVDRAGIPKVHPLMPLGTPLEESRVRDGRKRLHPIPAPKAEGGESRVRGGGREEGRGWERVKGGREEGEGAGKEYRQSQPRGSKSQVQLS